MLARLFNKSTLFICLFLISLPVTGLAGSFERGILWQINKPGMKGSYVMGTIHSDHPLVTTLPLPIHKAFNESSSFTAEIDLNMTAMLQAQKAIPLRGRTPKEIASS